MLLLLPSHTNFTPFPSTTRSRLVTSHLNLKQVQNEPKMPLDTTRSHARHTCFCCILVRFAPRPDIFELQAIFREVHQMIPQMPLNNTWSNAHHICMICAKVPNLISFRSTTTSFRVTAQFRTSAANDPKITLNSTRLKDPVYVLLRVPENQISLCLPSKTNHF